MAAVPPLFRELAVVECAAHVLESTLYWAPRSFPTGTRSPVRLGMADGPF